MKNFCSVLSDGIWSSQNPSFPRHAKRKGDAFDSAFSNYYSTHLKNWFYWASKPVRPHIPWEAPDFHNRIKSGFWLVLTLSYALILYLLLPALLYGHFAGWMIWPPPLYVNLKTNRRWEKNWSINLMTFIAQSDDSISHRNRNVPTFCVDNPKKKEIH